MRLYSTTDGHSIAFGAGSGGYPPDSTCTGMKTCGLNHWVAIDGVWYLWEGTGSQRVAWKLLVEMEVWPLNDLLEACGWYLDVTAGEKK